MVSFTPYDSEELVNDNYLLIMSVILLIAYHITEIPLYNVILRLIYHMILSYFSIYISLRLCL